MTNTIVTWRPYRWLAWALGASCIAWALVDPRFRDAQGFLLGTGLFPICLGMALGLAGWAADRRWRQSSLWLALALIGQAAALQMIDAGPTVRFQHYRAPGRLLTEMPPLLLLSIALQVALVVAGLWSRRNAIAAWVRQTFRSWQVLSLGGVLVLSSAALSRQVSSYATELLVASGVQALNLANIVLVAWALPDDALARLSPRLDRWLARLNHEAQTTTVSLDRFALIASLWVLMLTAFLSVLVYERHPHVPDEVMYLYQARYLASGVLTVPAPPVPEAFSFYLIPFKADRWYSIFSPGWPAVLALGVYLGVPWLVNPLLAGLSVSLAYLLVQELYDRTTARLTVFLLCASPWFLFMGMNYMAHTLTLASALVSALGVAWARKSGKAGWAVLAGGAAGMVSLIRPLDGLLVAGLVGLWALGFGGARLRLSGIRAFVLGVVLVGGLVLPYNWAITGDATRTPLMAYYEEYFGAKTNALGFGPERGLGWPLDALPGHSVPESLINASLNVHSLNTELFGWSAGSLILVLWALLSARWLGPDYLMISIILLNAILYGFYWFNGGADFGARYWYLMLVPLVVLSVRGIDALVRTLSVGSKDLSTARGRVLMAVFSLCALTVLIYCPWRAVDKYHHYRGMQPGIQRMAAEHSFGRSLVLIRGDAADYMSAWANNPLDPYDDAPIYAWYRDEGTRTRLLNAYGGRSVWIVDGPSRTQAGYRTVEQYAVK